MLAHTDSDVTSVYQRHQYDEQAREWLQKWANHLDALVADNVVPMGREQSV